MQSESSSLQTLTNSPVSLNEDKENPVRLAKKSDDNENKEN